MITSIKEFKNSQDKIWDLKVKKTPTSKWEKVNKDSMSREDAEAMKKSYEKSGITYHEVKITSNESANSTNESVTEPVMSEEVATALANDIKAKIKAIFPDSFVNAEASFRHVPTIHVWFALGKDKSEWANGISENDPAKMRITVWLDRLPLKVESATGSFNIKPPAGSNLAYGRVNVGWRNFSTDQTQVADKIGKYFVKLRDALIANIDNMTPEHAELARKKLGIGVNEAAETPYEFSTYEDLQNILEVLVEQPFVAELVDQGEVITNYEVDGEEDSEFDGREDYMSTAWIAIDNAKQSTLDRMNTDYKGLAKPFEDWAKQYGITNVDISTHGDDLIVTFTEYTS